MPTAYSSSQETQSDRPLYTKERKRDKRDNQTAVTAGRVTSYKAQTPSLYVTRRPKSLNSRQLLA